MNVPGWAVRHPAIVAILTVSLGVFGILAARSLNSEMIPPVGLPAANIVTTWPGAAARDIERSVTRPVENQLSTVSGVSDMTSTSGDSYSVVTLDFTDGTDVQAVLPRIRELLNAIREDLPDGISGDPVIYVSESSSFLPVFSARMESTMDRESLVDFLEERVSPSLARIKGVSRINISGGAGREVRITLDPDLLTSRGIAAMTVYEALRYGNVNFPAGSASWKGKELSITTEGAFSDLDDVGSLVVGYGDKSAIYLRDVATIELAGRPETVVIRSGGKDYVALDILKKDDGNTLDIVAQARSILDEAGEETGNAVTWAVITDQAETTRRSLDTVIQSGIMGLILTVLVIFVILHDLRATVVVSVSIPLSILFAIVGMAVSGRSLNLLSLSGITVAIGMIVDNSIVVLENTFKHFGKTGNREEAALKGAGEVFGAVIASTVTSVCVFAPLAFLTGIIGIIMSDLSLTIVFALAASALVAVVVVPWLSSIILRAEKPPMPGFVRKIESSIDRGMDGLVGRYRGTLAKAMGNKRYVIVLSLSVFAASVVMIGLLKISFIPPTDTAEFEIHIETPAGYSLERTKGKVDEIDMLVAGLVPEIEAAVYYVGSGSALTVTASPNRAFARIRLVPSGKRKRFIKDIIPVVQEAISRRITDCDATVLNGGFDSLLALGTGGQGFLMEIYGPDLDDVVQTAVKARSILDSDPDVFKSDLSVRFDSEQVYADLDPEAMGTLGVTAYEAGLTSRIMFAGMNAGTFGSGSKDVPVRLTSSLEGKSLNSDTLGLVSLKTRDGRTVSFSAFSEMKARPAVSSIQRRNRTFSVEVRGYLVSEDQSGVSSRVSDSMAGLNLPPSVKWRKAGTSELIGDSLSSLVLMLAISVFLVYAVMVIQFERFLQPLVIMVSIPFCLIGVVLGLYLFNSALSIIAMLALITLGGTVVNNAIVLVDYVNMLRRDYGMELDKAVIEGSANRIKPILMTAATTLLGVLPMALAAGNGSEVYAPLGQAIFGGLLSSTVITLFIVPVLYHSLETVSLRVKAAYVARRPPAMKPVLEDSNEE